MDENQSGIVQSIIKRVGMEQYRENLKMFLIFERVRSHVVSAPVVTGNEVIARAPDAAEGSPEWRDAERQITQDKITADWIQWLRAARQEATITIVPS
jgi:hypothetical protein